jgi:hypothetical protein
VTFENGSRLAEIPERAFSYTPLEAVVIPASIKVIGEEAFFFCSQLKSVTFAIGSQLQQVHQEAFFCCRCEGNVFYPSSYLSLGD